MILTRRITWKWMVAISILAILVFSKPVGSWLGLKTGPILQTLHAPVSWWQEISLWFEDRAALQDAYTLARHQAEQQAALIQEARSLREENRQLRRILGITSIPGYYWHAAKVRGRSPDTMSQRLIVQASGVAEDDVIVSSEGLVGVVDKADGQFATVRTILDASLAVPVTLAASPLAALLRGQGDSLEVDFVPYDQAPAVGSILQTSGAGGVFPPGIPVARIIQVEPREGKIFALVRAEPVAHWQRDNWLAVASREVRKQP